MNSLVTNSDLNDEVVIYLSGLRMEDREIIVNWCEATFGPPDYVHISRGKWALSGMLWITLSPEYYLIWQLRWGS